MTAARAAVVGLVLALGACGSAPDGEAARQPTAPLGTIVLIPGSGFNGAGVENAGRMSVKIASWRRWGFRTRVAAYRRGRAGLVDVARTVRAAHAALPNLPLCLYGESSGGTWALLAAARNPDVDCVVLFAAPTDQETLARSAQRPARHLARDVWPHYFGPASRDNYYEPFDVWSARTLDVPVLAVYAENDRIVPPQQGELFAPLGAATTLRVLRGGVHEFVHSRIDAGEFVRTRREVRRFAAAAGAG